MSQNRKKIHFSLPSGGIRGCFQAGFIYQLKKKYNDLFEIYQIDGCSIGSLNGLCLLFDNPEDIKTQWYACKNKHDIFDPWLKNKILDRIISVYNGIIHNGMYRSDALTKMIETAYQNVNKTNLDKYNCVVTNLSNGTYEYINGTNKNIVKFIVASASPRIITEPVNIDNKIYNDGNLLHKYPIDNFKNSKADIKLLIGYEINYDNKVRNIGNNIIEYLNILIDITRKHNPNLNKIHKYINKYNIITIDNAVNFDALDINIKNITIGFEKGIEAADIFAKKHLLNI